MIASLILALILLVGLLTLVSYVDRVYQEAGKFLSREFQDNIDVFEDKIEPKLGVTRGRAALSMAVLQQLTTAAIAVLFAYLIFRDVPTLRQAAGVLVSLAGVATISAHGSLQALSSLTINRGDLWVIAAIATLG